MTTREWTLRAVVAAAAIAATASSLSNRSAEDPLRFERRGLAIREMRATNETDADLAAIVAERPLALVPLPVPATFEPIGRRVLGLLLLALGGGLFAAALLRSGALDPFGAGLAGALVVAHPVGTVLVSCAGGLPTLLGFALAAGGLHTAAGEGMNVVRRGLGAGLVLAAIALDPILGAAAATAILAWYGRGTALAAAAGAALLVAIAATWEVAGPTWIIRLLFALLPGLAVVVARGATMSRQTRRARIIAAAGAAVVLGAAIGFGASWRDAETRWTAILARRADDTESERAAAHRGLSLVRCLDPARSDEALETLRSIDPPDPLNTIRIAELHLLRDEPEPCQRALREAWPDVGRGFGADPAALRSLYHQVAGRGLVRMRIWEQAESALRLAASPSVAPELAVTLDIRARIADFRGDRPLAMTRWHEAGKLDPQLAGPHVARARDHLLAGRFDQAEADLRRVAHLTRLPEDEVAADGGLALIELERGADPDEGDALLRFELAAEILSGEALTGGLGELGLVAEWLARPTIRELQHDKLDGLYAVALERTGRPREAVRVAEALRVRRPDDAAIGLMLAVFRLQLREFGEALALLEPLVKEHPEHFGARLNLAAAYRGMGREEDARRAADEALALAKTDRETSQVRLFLSR